MLWFNHDINESIKLAPSGLVTASLMATTFTTSLMATSLMTASLLVPPSSPSSFNIFKTLNTARKGFITFLFIMFLFRFISLLDLVH